MKIKRKYEKLLAKNKYKTERELKEMIAQFYEDYGDDVGAEIKKYDRDNKFKTTIRQKINVLYAENQKIINIALRELVLETTDDILQDLYKLYEKDIDDMPKVTGIKKSKDVTKIVNSDMSGLNWTERHKFNREDSIKKVQQAVMRNVINGERYSVVAKDLSKQLNVTNYQATRILRTESHRVLNESKQENYNEIVKAGIPLKKMWLSSQDERVRSTHGELDGQVVDIDKPFKINGYEAMYPGGFGVAELDINCRCEMVMLIE